MDIIELLKSAFMGLVEGITEWLPVSSTGHMILVDEFVKMNVSETFWNMFLVVIQLGAILAVCVLFFYDLNPVFSQQGQGGSSRHLGAVGQDCARLHSRRGDRSAA